MKQEVTYVGPILCAMFLDLKHKGSKLTQALNNFLLE